MYIIISIAANPAYIKPNYRKTFLQKFCSSTTLSAVLFTIDQCGHCILSVMQIK